MNIDFKQIPILEIIPQRPPFVMISRLEYCDMQQTTTTFCVDAENIFVEKGRLSAPALMENIAQTCAARMGFVNKYILKRNVTLGFIGAVKDMQISRTPIVGEELTTNISVIEEIMGLTLVKASVKVGEEQIVSAEMKIALSDIEADMSSDLSNEKTT